MENKQYVIEVLCKEISNLDSEIDSLKEKQKELKQAISDLEYSHGTRRTLSDLDISFRFSNVIRNVIVGENIATWDNVNSFDAIEALKALAKKPLNDYSVYRHFGRKSRSELEELLKTLNIDYRIKDN